MAHPQTLQTGDGLISMLSKKRGSLLIAIHFKPCFFEVSKDFLFFSFFFSKYVHFKRHWERFVLQLSVTNQTYDKDGVLGK